MCDDVRVGGGLGVGGVFRAQRHARAPRDERRLCIGQLPVAVRALGAHAVVRRENVRRLAVVLEVLLAPCDDKTVLGAQVEWITDPRQTCTLYTREQRG